MGVGPRVKGFEVQGKLVQEEIGSRGVAALEGLPLLAAD